VSYLVRLVYFKHKWDTLSKKKNFYNKINVVL